MLEPQRNANNPLIPNTFDLNYYKFGTWPLGSWCIQKKSKYFCPQAGYTTKNNHMDICIPLIELFLELSHSFLYQKSKFNKGWALADFLEGAFMLVKKNNQ